MRYYTYDIKDKIKKAKVGLLACSLLLFGLSFQTANAQERVEVEPDDYPAEVGALNLAIEEHGGDVIYVLQNGATYWMDAVLNYDHNLHIEAAEYPTDNPPILRQAVDLEGNSRWISAYEGDITAKGVFMLAMDDLGGMAQNQLSNAEGGYNLYQYCYFMAGFNYFFWNNAGQTSYRIEDTYFANFGRNTSTSNQRLFSTRGNDVDSVIVRNSTIYQFGNRIYDERGGTVDYFLFEHNTVVNHGFTGARTQGPFDMGIFNTMIVKNNLFRNVNVIGSWESEEVAGEDGHYYEGPRYYDEISWFDIDPLPEGTEGSDSDRTIVIKNNNFGGFPDEAYIDLWAEFSTDDPDREITGDGARPWGTDPQWLEDNPDITAEDEEWASRDTIPLIRVKSPIANVTLQQWIDEEASWVTFENNLDEQVALEDMPDDVVDYARQAWFGGTELHHYDRWESISADNNTRYFHPAPGTPTETTGNTGEWFRQLAISDESSPSFSHAENGYPLGNLNYYPELKEKWANGEVLTSAEEEIEIVDNFGLIGNYPNPFNPTTNIAFELNNQSAVILQVFNILGQKVTTMDLGRMNKGIHEVSFNGSEFSSGIYIVRLQSGNQIDTHRITLIK